MNLELRQVADGIYATSRTVMQAEVVDAITFDMDGVLINVNHSYPVVISDAAQAFLLENGFSGDEKAVTTEETAYFKAAGGFNSDWALTQGVVLIYLVKAEMAGSRLIEGLRHMAPDLPQIARGAAQFGGGLAGLERVLSNFIDPRDYEHVKEFWDRGRITRLAQEFYAGDSAKDVFGIENETVRGPGHMLNEAAMVSRERLLGVPLRYGLYTGRNRGEADIAIGAAGLDGIFNNAAIVTEDLGIRKPNPLGLFRIAAVLKPRLMLFVGDNLDDWQAAARYEAERSLDQPPCLFCAMLDGSPGPLAYNLFQDRGVDLMAKSVNDLLNWLIKIRVHT